MVEMSLLNINESHTFGGVERGAVSSVFFTRLCVICFMLNFFIKSLCFPLTFVLHLL